MRYLVSVSLLMLSALCLGCGGAKELPPDDSEVKQLSPEEIQRNIQEGMKKGGGTKQPELKK